jgi:peptidoglycan-N-acetylglucosamine deacetylase
MEAYHGKLIELLSIEEESNQSFLQIRLSIDQEILLFWEIDHHTEENLRAVTVFDEKYKYRLSFQSSWDSAENQYISYVTRTYRDQSEKVYFSCSEEYIKRLSAIKSHPFPSKIHKLPFLTNKIPSNDIEIDSELELKQKQDEVNSNNHQPFTWISVAMISVICIILLGYAGDSYLNKTVFAQKTAAKAVSTGKEIRVESKKKETHPPVDVQSKADHSIVTTPTLDLKQVVSYSVPEGLVSLSFDDGPSKYSTEIVDILKNYHVGGTFFFIGQNVKKYPDYVQYVHTNGFSIGNHSMTHSDFTNLSYEKQEKELLETNRLIEQIVHETIVLFRPPYGANNDDTIHLMKKKHSKMVLWNKDPKDWQNHNPSQILHYIKSSHASGSIIVLHESQAVVDALPNIIEYLQGQKLKMVNLK